MLQKALTLEKKGERESALKPMKKVETGNWYGGISYELVRNHANQKLSMNLGSNK